MMLRQMTSFIFLQHDGVMQDAASGTQSVKFSSGRRTNTHNAMRELYIKLKP